MTDDFGAARHPRDAAADPRGPLDPETLRADFPILQTQVNGHPLIYLDSASTSQKPRVVIEALDALLPRVQRQRPSRDLRDRRARDGGVRGGPRERRAVHQRARLARDRVHPERHGGHQPRRVLLGPPEHRAGRRDRADRDGAPREPGAWQLLVQEKDGDLEFIPITDDGLLRLDVFEVLLRLRPKLVAFTQVSNTLGTITPVREMVEMAHAAGALVLVDGAQAVPHIPVDVQELGCDFYAFSGHKMLAPMGSGALWARRELLEAMPPFLAGGEMIREVHLRRSEWNAIPWKFEAGTPDVAAAIGLGAAADYLRGAGHGARPRA